MALPKYAACFVDKLYAFDFQKHFSQQYQLVTVLHDLCITVRK